VGSLAPEFVRVSMFFARLARLDSVGQAERGKMSHEAECLAIAVHPVVDCSSNIFHERPIATPSGSMAAAWSLATFPGRNHLCTRKNCALSCAAR
jgi:hypothetical protein